MSIKVSRVDTYERSKCLVGFSKVTIYEGVVGGNVLLSDPQ